VTAGFRFLQKPRTGNLMSTMLESRIDSLAGLAAHTWSADDRGPTSRGYEDNSALGWLRLDGAYRALFTFSGVGVSNALYIDYLELANYATNFAQALLVDPSITVYFANANVPASKLDGRFNGHLRWVPTFAGPNSSTQAFYAPGLFTNFNTALVQSADLDSNGDGVVNSQDPCPFCVYLNVQKAAGPPPRVEIRWNQLAGFTNVLQGTTNITQGNWRDLTNFFAPYNSAPISDLVTISLTNGIPYQDFRVRIVPP
jgi:hypothetical protein